MSNGEVITANANEQVGIDELKSMPGAEFLSDDDFKAMLGAVDENPAEPQETEQTEISEQPQPLKIDGLTVYLDDKPVEDLRSLSVEDLLTKAVFGYKAIGAEQKKALKDVIRVAQLGHLNERNQNQLKQDLAQISSQLEQVNTQYVEAQKQLNLLDRALQRAAVGDVSLLQQMVDNFAANFGLEDEQPKQMQMDPQQQRIAAGQALYEQEIKPYLQRVAQEYGINDVDALGTHALTQLASIPAMLLTPERVTQYLTHDLIAEIEAGIVGNAPAHTTQPRDERGRFMSPNSSNSEVAELRKELSQLKEMLSNRASDEKLRKAPPASAPSGGVEGLTELPEFMKEDSFDMNKGFEWLRSR